MLCVSAVYVLVDLYLYESVHLRTRDHLHVACIELCLLRLEGYERNEKGRDTYNIHADMMYQSGERRTDP